MPSAHMSYSVGAVSMQASKKHRNHRNAVPTGEPGNHFIPQNYQPVHTLCSTDGTQIGNNTLATELQYCTLESSSATSGCNTAYNSPTTLSFSPTTSSPISNQDCQSENTYGSPISVSCITEDPDDLRHKLKELETAMLGPDSDDIVDSIESALHSHLTLEPEKWLQAMDIPRGDLKQTLIACAQAMEEKNNMVAEWLVAELRQMVSVSGDPIQRLGAYMVEGLVARLSRTGSSIYKALRCKEPPSADLLSYMQILFEVCPYYKFGYLSANGAIAEAFKGENRVHIIDFQIAMGSQWVTLIQALAARPGGPPHVRITGVDDSVSAYARGGGLDIVGRRLTQFAKSLGVPLEFHPAVMSASEIQLGDLCVQPGEALAVNFAYQLHHLPDESVDTTNHRDRLLRMVKRLHPKVVALVEQESNTNTSPFVPRFVETLSYYTAVFESIDVTLPRDSKERINAEQHCLARDIVNMIACEGAERVERHELLGKWRSRFTMAGFSPVPLSPLVNATIKSLLEKYSEHYRLEERDGALYLGWKNRALVVSCAWR
ncbi:scarecrow-like protein 21 [Iris pallida]|uniref:Scarecrow-like protein 21 n=1 Tax=Iris pallida TaxID=29817 RepID=A0AAX6F5R2_IRIPA|nr:scarecrow-like protein 21 [Iris pallida]